MLGLAASVTTEDPMWVKTRACRLCRPGAPSIIEQTQGKTLSTKQIAGKGGGGCEAWASCGVSNSFPVTRAGASRARQPCSEGHGPPARPQCLTPSSGTGAKPTRGKTQAKVPTIEVRPSVASRTAGTGLTPKPLPTTSRSFCLRRLHLALPAGNRAERLHTGG